MNLYKFTTFAACQLTLKRAHSISLSFSLLQLCQRASTATAHSVHTRGPAPACVRHLWQEVQVQTLLRASSAGASRCGGTSDAVSRLHGVAEERAQPASASLHTRQHRYRLPALFEDVQLEDGTAGAREVRAQADDEPAVHVLREELQAAAQSRGAHGHTHGPAALQLPALSQGVSLPLEHVCAHQAAPRGRVAQGEAGPLTQSAAEAGLASVGDLRGDWVARSLV